MIQEAYCSYEVSKLLKEKGFNESIRCWYDNFQDFHEEGVRMNNTDCLPPTIMCPTHQMAMKWLREKHNICITIYPDVENGYEAVLYNIENNVEIVLQSFGIYGIHIYKKIYEEAVEAALKYCIEKIIK